MADMRKPFAKKQTAVQPILVATSMPLLAAVNPLAGVAQGKTASQVNFGIYDPEGKCQRGTYIAIEHLFISWAAYRPGDLLRQLGLIGAKGRRPLITIEPWCDQAITSQPSELLSDVTKGKYDHRIQDMVSEIAAFRDLVLLRWGHEMENVSSRYPWASVNAALYQEAYRHFVDTCRRSAGNVIYVWSPAGESGLARYWPGEAYVDCVGLSVFEFPAFDEGHFHRAARSFHDQMAEKYARVAKYEKPIVISECGVTGSTEYQLSWLQGAFQDVGNYPLLKALIYFNAKETPGVWGKEYTAPDWRISERGLLETVAAGQ
jgi:cellulose synthase (UDP-forming)